MRRTAALSALLVLLPLAALAGSCPSVGKTPCLPDDATKAKLLEKIRSAQRWNAEIQSARLIWSNAVGSADKEDELKKYEAFLRAKVEFDRESSELMSSIQAAYNVAPEHTSGSVRKPGGAGHAMDWMSGISAKWRPSFSANNDDYREIPTRKGMHYASVNTAGLAGSTLPNGDVIIASALLSDALIDQNPGVIADAIYHEGRHFNELVTTGWASIEQTEVNAYSAAAAHNDVFKLSPGWLKRNADALALNQGAIQAGTQSAYVITAQEEGAIKAQIDQLKAGQVDMAAYYQTLKGQVAKDAADREHDERLLATLADIAGRSCALPGSIGQDELDRLPRPAKPEQFCVPESCRFPPTLGSCAVMLYLDLAGRMRQGTSLDAADLQRRSEPVVPAPVRPNPPPPQPVRPVEPPPRLIGEDPAAETIKNFRRLGALACDSPERLDADEVSRAVRTPYIPLPMGQTGGSDLAGCARFVYDALVIFTPEGYRGMLTKDWLSDRVRAYRAQASPPPSGGGGDGQSPEPPKRCYWDSACNCRICEQ